MKVSVTIELDDDQRIAVGLMETGKLAPASREEVRTFASNIVNNNIGVATDIVIQQRQVAAAHVREALGMNVSVNPEA